jgi:putative intracellular protease/amidase
LAELCTDLPHTPLAGGAKFEKTKAWGEKVVVDQNNGRTLITGQNPASAGALAKEVIKALKASA